jgi:hypothetical protein
VLCGFGWRFAQQQRELDLATKLVAIERSDRSAQLGDHDVLLRLEEFADDLDQCRRHWRDRIEVLAREAVDGRPERDLAEWIAAVGAASALVVDLVDRRA